MSDFKTVADAALARADSLVPEWLPDGKREGDEWCALNPVRHDQKRGSFKVNLVTGVWADFASDDKGSNLLDLYVYVKSVSPVVALRELASSLGVTLSPFVPGKSRAPSAPIAQAVQAVYEPKEKKKRSEWTPITPIPLGIVDAPRSHFHHGQYSNRWLYINQAGETLGYVYRFDKEDGRKEILPCVFAVNDATGERKWHWMQWQEPRPLYFKRPLRDGKKVLIVEGEKCVDAAFEFLGDRADIISWPGGGKATSKVDWSLLEGRQVLIWPDADSQREKLTKDEAEAGTDKASKPYLPWDKQPGVVAAEQIAAHLVKLNCSVRIMEVPHPGEVSDGWDIADAINEGITIEECLQLMAVSRDPVCLKEKVTSTPRTAGASTDWHGQLIRKGRGGWEDCYQNVYIVLANHPEWKGVIAYDEFAQVVIKTRATPCHTEAGEWKAYDDQRLGLWLAQVMGIVIKGDGPIAAGVSMAANENRIHPIREYLSALKWDGQSRLDKWVKFCMGGSAAVTDDRYLSIAGSKFLIGSVARIFEPGCKMDNMLVFEGGQGKGKSTAVRILGSEWFSDSHLDLQSKDCYMALNGVWFYEVAEMDAFSRAEATRVKAFITSPVDNYREPYQRREITRPRQVVFIGSTNQNEYLKDVTGNRRYWPVRIDGDINLPLLREWRDQLFAEAVHLYNEGAKWHVTGEEEITLFIPEQDFRCIDDPWVSIIGNWIAGDGNVHTELTVDMILTKAIGMEPDRMSGTKSEAQRIAPILKALGYERSRDGKKNEEGKRATVYVKRKGALPAQAIVKQEVGILG